MIGHMTARRQRGCACFVLFLAMSVSSSAQEADRSPQLRAGYLPASADRKILAKMRGSGLNAAWPKITSFRGAGEEQAAMTRIRQWAAACEPHEMQLWPVVNFAGGTNDRDVFPNFRREVTLRGVVNQNTPCPVDESYWRAVVFPRFLTMARLSQSLRSLRGGVLDMEMYGADHAGYGGACACESCQRGAGSAEQTALLDWQRREVAQIGRELEREVHRVAPEFQFAVMHLEEPYPFYEGLALGLGTPQVPVICASERTYSIGYTPEVDATRERFVRLKAHVSYLGGLWIQEFRSQQVAPQLFALGSHGGGFWLYTLGSLAEPTDKVPEGYRVPDPQDEYWAAFGEASRELDRFTESRGHYKSPLLAKFVPADQRLTIKKRILEPVPIAKSAIAATVPSEQIGEGISLFRYNVLFVPLKAGETIRLQTRGIAQSSKHTKDGAFKLIDPDGRDALTRPIRLGQVDEFEFQAQRNGTHWLTTNMFLNACELTIPNRRAVYWGGQHHRLKLSGTVRPLFFWVGEGQSPKLDVITEDPNEPVQVKLLSPRQKVVAEREIGGTGQIAADGPSGCWTLVIEPTRGESFANVLIGLAAPLSPYFADSPERLLRDKE